MKMTARKAVDPIIASLLLIAIAVAAGIIVYVYVNSLTGSLTQGGGQQVSEQVEMDGYGFTTLAGPVTVTVRDTGGASVSVANVFFDGLQCATGGLTCTAVTAAEPSSGGCTGTSFPVPCSTSQYVTLSLTLANTATAGTTHSVRIETSDGGSFTYTVIAGRSG